MENCSLGFAPERFFDARSVFGKTEYLQITSSGKEKDSFLLLKALRE